MMGHVQLWLVGLSALWLLPDMPRSRAFAGLVLNEFMSSNGATLEDEDGDYEDWIELFHAGGETLDLAGWGLSDDTARPFKWTFPSVVLEPGAYLVVFASGKNRADEYVPPDHPDLPWSPLHANFSIGSGGEELLLSRPDGSTADQIGPVAVPRDISYGRTSDGWAFFGDPTPGRTNDTLAYVGVLGAPSFSHESGFYDNSMMVTLSAPEGVTILYTLDGSEPDAANIGGGEPYLINYFYPGISAESDFRLRQNITYVYSSPIPVLDRTSEPSDLAEIITTYSAAPTYFWSPPGENVPKGRVIRARAWKEHEELPSETITRSFYVTSNRAQRLRLPVLAITTEAGGFFGFEDGINVAGRRYFDQGGTEHVHGGIAGNPTNTGRAWERAAHIEFFNTEGALEFEIGTGLRIHGGLSRRNEHRALRLYFRSSYGDDELVYPLFPDWRQRGIAKEEQRFRGFQLFTGGHIRNQLHDTVANEIMDPAEVGIQRLRAVNYYVNGEYWGVVHIRDRIDEHYIEEHYGVSAENVILLNAPAGIGHPNQVEVGQPDDILLYRDLYQYAVTNDLSSPELYQHVEALMDVSSYMDYKVMFIYLGNGDWGGSKHFRFWRVRETSSAPFADGRWRLIVWDFDVAGLWHEVGYDLLASAIDPNGAGAYGRFHLPERTAMLRSLLENTQFRHQFVNRFADHMNSTFRPHRIIELAQARYNILALETPEHQNRWGRWPTHIVNFNSWVHYANHRPGHMKEHLQIHFDVGSDVTVTIDRTEGGTVRINSLLIDAKTPGLPNPDQPYPWQGDYFLNVPITLEALPEEGFRFLRWEITPEGQSPYTDTDAVLQLALAEDTSIEAVFQEIVSGEATLVHYWSFNDTANLLVPTYTLVAGAGMAIDTGTVAGVTSGTGQDFWGENARFDNAAGAHLRINNPTGAVMSVALPTTGFEDVVVMYETRRSGSGAGTQHIEYTLDGSGYIPFTTRIVTESPTLHIFDFAGISGANDNANFGMRVTFEPGSGDIGGNNRFDNMTLEAVPLAVLNLPPEEVDPIGFQELIQGAEALILNLNNVFTDPDGDPMTFGVSSSDPSLVAAEVDGSLLTVHPLQRGEALVTLTVDDGNNLPVSSAFRVLVYPDAHVLRDGAFAFETWDADTPEKTYPAHMLFLQSDRIDTLLDTALDYAYSLGTNDYHADDQGTVGFPYNNTRRTRINGLGEDGIAFINTGQGRDLGGALLALNTRDTVHPQVAWTAGTIQTNSRIYALRLQYRIGRAGDFQDVLNDEGDPVEYIRHGEPGHSQVLGPFRLPDDALDQDYVQLLWRYYLVEGSSGARAQLRLDDVRIESATSDPIFNYRAWVQLNFAEHEREEEAISGPLADPDVSGVPNLLRYAMGIGRHDAYENEFSRISFLDGRPVIRYRRRLGGGADLTYLLEISENLSSDESWSGLTDGEDMIFIDAELIDGGQAEVASYELLLESNRVTGYIRLKIILSVD